MEKTTAIFGSIACLVVGAFLCVAVHLAHIDNDREKDLVVACINAGGEPVYYPGDKGTTMRGCDKP